VVEKKGTEENFYEFMNNRNRYGGQWLNKWTYGKFSEKGQGNEFNFTTEVDYGTGIVGSGTVRAACKCRTKEPLATTRLQLPGTRNLWLRTQWGPSR
jgi:hypothetical protein